MADTEEASSNDAMANFAYMANTGELDPGKPNIPRSIAEAKASPEWPQWEHAINAELENLATMGTWELEDCPVERKPIGCRWVFDSKQVSKRKLSAIKRDS
jgi:hypothetical protein